MVKTSDEQMSHLVWRLDFILIFAEIIFAAIVYSMYGGLAYLAFGHDSVGELISNLVVLIYIKRTIFDLDVHHHHGTAPHEHEFHARETKASQYVAFVFFGLALSTVIWPLLAGVEHAPTTVLWPRVTLVIFTIITGIMGVIKWRQSHGKDDPRWADALQSILCVVSGVIAALAAWLEKWFEQSHLYADVAIAALMFVAGCMIINNKKVCC